MFCRILYIILLAPLGIFAAAKATDGACAGDGSTRMAELAAARPVGPLPTWVHDDPATGAFIYATLAPTYGAYKARFEGLFSFSFLRGDGIAKAGAEQAAKALQKEGITKRLGRNFSEAEAAFLQAAQLGNVGSMSLLGNMYMCTENAAGSLDYVGAYYWYVLGAQTEYLLSGAYPESLVGKLNALKALGETSADPMARIASFYAGKAIEWLGIINGMLDKEPPVDFSHRCLPFLLGGIYAEETNAMPLALRNLRTACTTKIAISYPGRTQEDGNDDVGIMPDFRGEPMTLSQEVERPDLRLYPHIELQDAQTLGLTNVAGMPRLQVQIARAYLDGSYGLHMSLEERKALALRLLVAADMSRNAPDQLSRWAQWLAGGVIDINERGEKVEPENTFTEGMSILWNTEKHPDMDKIHISKSLILMMLKGLSEGRDIFNAEGRKMTKSEINANILQLVHKLEKVCDRPDANMDLIFLYREWAMGVLDGKIHFDSELSQINVIDPSAKIKAFLNIMAKRFHPDMIKKIVELKKCGLIDDHRAKQYQDTENEAIYRITDICGGRGFSRKDIPQNVKQYMHKSQQLLKPRITMDKALDVYYQRMAPQDAPGLLKYAKAISKGDRIVGMDGKEITAEERGNEAHSIYSGLLGTRYQLNALNGIGMLIEENLVTKDEVGGSFAREDKHKVLERIYGKIYHIANDGLRRPENREYYEHYKMLAMECFITALEKNWAEKDLEGVLITPENREERIDYLLRQSTKSYHIAHYAMRVYDGLTLVDEAGEKIRGHRRFPVAQSIIERITNAGYRNYVLGELYVREAIANWEAFSAMTVSERSLELAGEYLAILKKAKPCFAEAMAEDVGNAKDRWSGIRSEIRRMKGIVKKHKALMSKATVVVPTEASVSGVSAVSPTVSGAPTVGEVESSDSDEEKEMSSVVPAGGVSAGFYAAGEHDLSAAGSVFGSALADAGGPSLFEGTSLLEETLSTSKSKAKKAPEAKPLRHNHKILEDAEKRAQLPKAFDRWEMSKRSEKDFRKIPPVLREKIFKLIDEIRLDQAAGRPEYLCGDMDGWMSRHVTDGDRLVYKIVKMADGRTILEIKDCKGHYDD